MHRLTLPVGAVIVFAWAIDAAAECGAKLVGIVYSPLAVQARIEGTVSAKFVLEEGLPPRMVALEGHPLLRPAVATAIDAASWKDCEDGEQEVSVEFRLTDAGKQEPILRQTGPRSFEVTVIQSCPCLNAMMERVVRRYWFWRKRITVCEEICEPCRPPGASGTSPAR